MAVADVPAEPRVIPSLKQAWTNIWPSFWWLFLFGFIAGVANGVQGGDWVPVLGVRIFLDVAGGLLSLFLGVPLGFGLVKAHLAASRGEKPTWSDLGYAFRGRYWQSVLLGLLSFLIVLGGLILLVIPGIYLGVRLTFAGQRFVEGGLDARGAIKASFADTRGRWWSVFALALMSILLFLGGILALGVGVFVAMVLVSQMGVVYWRAIQARDEAPGAPAPS